MTFISGRNTFCQNTITTKTIYLLQLAYSEIKTNKTKTKNKNATVNNNNNKQVKFKSRT